MTMKLVLILAVVVVLSALSAQTQTHSATLTWQDTANPAGTTYSVYRSTGLCSGTPMFSMLWMAVCGVIAALCWWGSR